LALEDKRELVEVDNSQISLRRQCQLLGLHRSGLYYQPSAESAENLQLMNLLDEQYTRTPFYGVRRMTAWLNQQGSNVNEKRVRRLLRQMGLEAIYPKPRLSQPALGAQVYPYLLKDVGIKAVDQVWSTDITYIRLVGGFIYLMAILDWYSRYVVEWEISVTLDGSFCIAALERALLRGRPEIFNTDQGSQFTSQSFTGKLLAAGIQISMDGRGRALDNIFVERLWRSVKYEEVYLKDYRNVVEAKRGLGDYFEFYNSERLHQSLGYQTPEEVYRLGQRPAAETTLI
jgi:putative transposase